MNNEMSKAIMARTKLGNRFLKNMRNRDRDLFLKQKNLCVNIKRKSEKDYLTQLKEKQVTDNKRFWKTVKFFLSNKVRFSERINLTEKKNSLITDCGEVPEELNSFFSYVVKNLNIPNYEGCDPVSDNIDHFTLKAIVKWRTIQASLSQHQSMKIRPNFPLIFFLKEHVLEKIEMLDSSKSYPAIFLLR